MRAGTSSSRSCAFLRPGLMPKGAYGVEGRYTSHHSSLKSQVSADCKHSQMRHVPQSEYGIFLSSQSPLGPFMVNAPLPTALSSGDPSSSCFCLTDKLKLPHAGKEALQPVSLEPQCESEFRSLLRTQFPGCPLRSRAVNSEP